MQKSWTIKTPEGDRDFETPQEAAEYLKGRRGTHTERAVPVSLPPEYSTPTVKADKVKAEATPSKSKTIKRGVERTAPSRSSTLDEFDFLNYSLAELDEIIEEANKAKRSFVDRRRAELLAELQALDELESTKSPRGHYRRKETKPRNLKLYADDRGNSWRGAGRTPAWLKDRIKKGAKLEDFLVSAKEK